MSRPRSKNKAPKLSQLAGQSITGKYAKFGNLANALVHAAGNPERGITFIQNDNSERFLSYQSLYDEAAHRLGGLQEQGFKPGEYALILLEDSREFILTFWACVLGGIIAVPASYPQSSKVINTSLSKLLAIWEVLEQPRILSDRSLLDAREEMETTLGISGLQILEAALLDQTGQEGVVTLADAHTPALIQFSSGSTNTPKGTILTHDNLLTNIEAIISSTRMSDEDRALGWMPYHHDMGLIGFHLSTLVCGINQFNMTPMKFVKRPTLWLDMIDKHRITFSGCPNFGLRLVSSRVKEEQLSNWDLSSLRLLFNGAEPISVKTMREFMDKFSRSGFKPNAMFPVYGMAEACLAVSFPAAGEVPVVHMVNREVLVREARIEEIAEQDKRAALMADEGTPVHGMEIRIAEEETGIVVSEGTVGEIQIRGRNVTSGYINNPEATAKSFQDGWLKTGDTGFILNGRLTVSGRIKDIVFVNGLNFFAHDIEAVIEELDGVEPGKIAVCGWHDEIEGVEKVGLFSTLRLQEKDVKPLYAKILRYVNESIGIPVDYVSFIRSIPKTTSGKVQRFILVESFKKGDYQDKTFPGAYFTAYSEPAAQGKPAGQAERAALAVSTEPVALAVSAEPAEPTVQVEKPAQNGLAPAAQTEPDKQAKQAAEVEFAAQAEPTAQVERPEQNSPAVQTELFEPARTVSQGQPGILSEPAGETQAAAAAETELEGLPNGAGVPLQLIDEPSARHPEAESEQAKGPFLELVREIWAAVLERPAESIPYNESFLSIGGTSLKAMQILGALEDELQIELTHDLLIKCRTVLDMNEYLAGLVSGHGGSGQDDPADVPAKQPAGETAVQSASGKAEAGKDGEIAVVAMACRFPGASSPEEFWRMLVRGEQAIGEVPANHWNIEDYYSSVPEFGKTYCRTGGFLDNPYGFDAGLFGISEAEAAVMDPQQRMILELTYELIERAGYSRQQMSGRKIGLFVGAGGNSYFEYHLNTLNRLKLQSFDSFSGLSPEQQENILEEWRRKLGFTEVHPNLLVDNILNMIPARTSQEFNFKGPSMAVDTACSSSLVTLHLAADSIRRGECESAIAGGIHLLLTPTPYQYFSNAGALSTSGHCSVFDAAADGFVPGEGGGLVMLKPLEQALRDGDNVLAVLKASEINNDGHSIGVMAPNPDGQRELIESLYTKNGLNPADIQYVEAHGTGTKIGDPSEVRALSRAFKQWGLARQSIAIGSVKSNIGHLLGAAGIASFIKIVMALQNRTLPPQANVVQPNPMLKFEQTPFYLLSEASEWRTAEGAARRAAINSFGFGGTNSHMVVEEAPQTGVSAAEAAPKRPKHVIALSAFTPAALERKKVDLAAFLERSASAAAYPLEDVCYTENTGRTALPYRFHTVADSREDLIGKLKTALPESLAPASSSPKVALMFTGQGAQYAGMGRVLYEQLPAFRKVVDECAAAFYPYLSLNLTDLIYGPDADNGVLALTHITQPVIFTMDYAFGRLLLDAGIKPAYLLGHSIGEWAAACLADAVGLADAARLVAARGRLMSKLPAAGAMAAVFTTGSTLEGLLEPFADSLWIAGYNITHQVISGSAEAVDAFIAVLQEKHIGAKKLNVSQAFHTPLMSPMLEAFRKELEKTTFRAPQIPVISNVSGEVIQEPFTAEYWLRHILEPVKFEQSLAYASSQQVAALVECGPDAILAGMAAGLNHPDKPQVLYTLSRKKENWETWLDLLGGLFSLGAGIDWSAVDSESAVNSGHGYRKVILPVYPFEHKTYMPDFGAGTVSSAAASGGDWLHEWRWSPVSGRMSVSKGAPGNAGPGHIEEDKEAQLPGGVFRKEETWLSGGAVLLWGGSPEIAAELRRRLAAGYAGHAGDNPVYRVSTGDRFHFDGEGHFTIRPEVPDDYAALLEHMLDKPAAVIHLSNYLLDGLQAENLLNDSRVIHESFYSLLHLGRELARKGSGLAAQLAVVTNKAYTLPVDAGGGYPQQAAAATLAQALDLEHENLAVAVLDFDREEYHSAGKFAEALLTALSGEQNEESVAAIRGGARYVRSLAKIPGPAIGKSFELHDGETYLITGGTGLVGGQIALEFARQAKVNVVLTGRKPHPANPSLMAKLEELGAQAMYMAVDVTDQAQMEELLHGIHAAYGPLHGVVHAAGQLEYAPHKLSTRRTSEMDVVLAPKWQGTVIVDLATRQEPLRFFAALSSVSATRKAWSSGLGDYAAANAFLNGYSAYRAKENAPGRSLSVNYSLWADTGAGTEYGDLIQLTLKAQGLTPLAHGKAASAFLTALGTPGPEVIHILDLAKSGVKPAFSAQPRPEQPERQTTAAALGAGIRPQGYRSAKEIRETVYGAVAEQLQIPVNRLETGTNFMELGLDSLGAVQVVSKLGTRLNTELYPTLIFEYQTPAELAAHIEELFAEAPAPVVLKEGAGESRESGERSQAAVQDVAIIGLGLRIPGANNQDEYWDLLRSGRSAIGPVAAGRWSDHPHVSSDPNQLHATYVDQGGFIDAPYDFDPLFFGMSPKEAEAADPQQRIFLQIAWEALQQGGYGGKYRTRKIGVFVGCEQNTYMEHFANYRSYMLIKNRLASSPTFSRLSASERSEILAGIAGVLEPARLVPDTVAGNGLNEVAARVSHCLNLTGPSLIVNTACSSSLVAIHLACESLQTGESEMAIAGGVNLNLSPTPFVSLSRVTALSPTGACYPFDKRANGMVLGEGAGAVLLKPLEAALRDGDYIHAVIKGSAINNDGRSQGITAPRPQGQAEVIRAAFLRSGIHPESISYIETHGTATPLGDPIEIEGMTQAFSAFTDKKQFCGIGSVKSTVGHMLSAAGVTSLIKVVLALKHQTLPHTLNYEQPNPNINFEQSPFYVVDKHPRPWKAEENAPLRASVNAFGFGGTNAHIILEQAPQLPEMSSSAPSNGLHLLLLTGRNEQGLKAVAGKLRAQLELQPELGPASVCHTLNLSQKEMSFKAAAVITSREHLLRVLAAVESGGPAPEIGRGRSNPSRTTPVHLLLSGRHSLSAQELAALGARFPGFEAAYRKAKQAAGTEGEASESFAAQFALGRWLLDLRLHPSGIFAEGTGVYAALALTGRLSLRQAGLLLSGGQGGEVSGENTSGSSVDAEAKEFVKCPVITPAGELHRELPDDLRSFAANAAAGQLPKQAFTEALGTGDVLLDCDGSLHSNSRSNSLADNPVPAAQIVNLSLEVNAVENLLQSLARLYTLGVPFDPAGLAGLGERKVLLPTYPFANEVYKVSFEDDAEVLEAAMAIPHAGVTEKTGLKKIEV